MQTTESERAGLYVHVPFCRQKCRYCDFYSIPSVSRIPEWLRALEREALIYKERFSAFDTLYLGGGTPSLLATEDLARLVEFFFRHFSLPSEAEVTLEANPNDVTVEKMHIYSRLGFNRISLGVQSMEDGELALLGRRHSARQAARAMERIRASGFFSFGVDLLYGTPGQTETEWQRTLERVLALEPDHISCYQLTLSPGTPLWEMLEAGRIVMPDEEQESRLFVMASEVLETQGFVHYEVSNYARGGLHVCRHNAKYWERVPYLGLGPSAHSFLGDARWWNHRSVTKYCQELSRGGRPVEGFERLSDEQAALERLSLQLRTRAGVPMGDLAGYEKTDRVLPGLLEAGLLQRVGERAVPTREGFLVADRLPLMFL
jgi:oxygen-independent coproporphyrinogen-3 oxidase